MSLKNTINIRGAGFESLLRNAQGRDSFHVDAAKLELSEAIFTAMLDSGVSEAELARRMGVSRAYVNRILKGTANLTIESLVKIGRSLERDFRFEFARFAESPDRTATVVDPKPAIVSSAPEPNGRKRRVASTTARTRTQRKPASAITRK